LLDKESVVFFSVFLNQGLYWNYNAILLEIVCKDLCLVILKFIIGLRKLDDILKDRGFFSNQLAKGSFGREEHL